MPIQETTTAPVPTEVPGTKAAAAAQAQLDAYNARDIDRFVACYSADVTVRDLITGEIRMQGRQQMRETYGKQFVDAPNQRAHVYNRQVAGDVVFDTEYVDGNPSGRTTHVTAIYHVVDGVIEQVWFTPPYGQSV